NRAIDALEGTSPLPDEALLVSAYRATQYKNRNRRGSTYEELISTGTIGLIRDPQLRDRDSRVQRCHLRQPGARRPAVAVSRGLPHERAEPRATGAGPALRRSLYPPRR